MKTKRRAWGVAEVLGAVLLVAAVACIWMLLAHGFHLGSREYFFELRGDWAIGERPGQSDLCMVDHYYDRGFVTVIVCEPDPWCVHMQEAAARKRLDAVRSGKARWELIEAN